MFFHHKNKYENKDGIVVVSIRNLFHLFDLSRKEVQEESNSQNSNTQAATFSEQISLKKRETFQFLNSNKKESNIESKIDENKIEETKDFLIKHESNINETKDESINTKESTKKMLSINKLRKKSNKKRKKTNFCDYFTNLILCNVLLLIFNNCILWIFCYMSSIQKNISYCYNPFLREFEICVDSDFCPSSGNHDFIYINDDDLSDIEIKREINNINNKYLNFYNYESKVFSKLNKKFIKTDNTLSKYSITIILTKNENYLFNNTFRVGCESYLLGILIMITISSTIGTLLFGLLADIFGRKKILISANIIQIIGGLSLFLWTFFIKKYNKEDIFKEKFSKDFIISFAHYFNESNSFSSIYINNYIDIKNEVLKTKIINNNFKKFNIFIFISMFLIFLSNSSIKIISLSYMLENALTEEKVMLYFFFFNFSQPISILLSTIMVVYTNSFEYPILICSAVILIITVLFIIFFYESQRYNFEYCFYSQITEFSTYIVGKEELNKNYRVESKESNNNMEQINTEKENTNYFSVLYSTDDYRIQSELNNEKINIHTHILDTIKFDKNQFYKELYSRNLINQYKSKNLIELFNIYKNPFYIFKLIFADKHIKKKPSIIIGFIINLSIVINLPLQRITSSYLFQREKLISRNVFINYLFLCVLLIIIILFPFVHYLTKCFGIYVVLFPFLVLINIGTWLFEILCFVIPDKDIIDITKYDDSRNDKIIDNGNKYLLPQIFIISISLVCLDYVLYFYIIKLTKTIYRCSLLALAQIIYNLSFVIGFGLENFINGGYYFAGIFSGIAFINSFFINSSDDSLNINEIREIKYDENKDNNI